MALESTTRKTGSESEKVTEQCGCLPECSETFYDIDVIQARRRRSAFYTAQFASQNITSKVGPDAENIHKMAVLKVHFEDITCLKYRREAVMTWDGLFATFGGIVGLCLGGSVLSVVEIIYYATLRLWVAGVEEEKIVATEERVPVPRKAKPTMPYPPTYHYPQTMIY